MTRLARALLRIATDLSALRVRWALVGGLAVAVRAEPRTTRDVDLAIAVRGDAEAEQLVRALRQRGYREKSEGIVEHRATGRLATVRLIHSDEGESGVVVDILMASSGIEPEIVAQAEELEVIEGVSAPVATVHHLLALKVLAGRPQDLQDAVGLVERATTQDLVDARTDLELISRRGYDRGKELQVELEHLLAGR